MAECAGVSLAILTTKDTKDTKENLYHRKGAPRRAKCSLQNPLIKWEDDVEIASL